METIEKKIIAVDGFDNEVLRLSNEFDQIMEDDGYENPFWRARQAGSKLFENFKQNAETDVRQWLIKKPLPTSLDEEIQPQVLTPGKKYISQSDYTKKKQEYIAKELYKKFGMTDKVKHYIEVAIDRTDLFKIMKPCLVDGQCSFLCPDFPCNE